MVVLVVGASGGIGSQVVKHLLAQGYGEVRILLRSKNSLKKFSPEELKNDNLKIFYGSVLGMKADELTKMVSGCDAIVSGLGHNMTFRGLWLPPRNLVTDTARKLVDCVKALKESKEDTGSGKPVRFIWVNTVGVGNPDGSDKKVRSLGQDIVLGLLRMIIFPHRDNCRLSEYFYHKVGKKSDAVRWCVVRPDGLMDADVSDYEVFPDLQNGLFDPKVTTRANVGHFMAKLVSDDNEWEKWENGFPVILNKAQKKPKK